MKKAKTPSSNVFDCFNVISKRFVVKFQTSIIFVIFALFSLSSFAQTKADLTLKATIEGDCKRTAGDLVNFKIVIKRQDNETIKVNVIVKDSLSANFTFVSASPSRGIYDNTSGEWSGINLAEGDSATLLITAKIKKGAVGLMSNEAWVSYMDILDMDSQAGNKNDKEDDFARASVSVPILMCAARLEEIILTAPAGYGTYQWFKNGTPINGANSSMYQAKSAGEYSVTVDAGSCPANACCPIYIEDVCECPALVCVPFAVQKTKSFK